MNDTEIQPILTSIIKEAGELVKEGFYTTKQISFKSPSDPVTNIDLASETLIRERLGQYFPDIEILGEEYGGNIISDELRWVIDPIDGTRNFAAGLPHFCVSIGLVQGNNPVVGSIYDPIRDELFFSQSNQGATLNGESMQVSTKTNPGDFIIGLDIGRIDDKAIHALKLIENLFPTMQCLRVFGSAALGMAYAASGRIDIFLHHSLSPWDIAAGLLLVTESNGITLDKATLKQANLLTKGLLCSSEELLNIFLKMTENEKWYQ